VFTLTGLLILAATVLLPEYAVLARLQVARDGLAHQLGCEERLAGYNERLLRAKAGDLVLQRRLVIRHHNYRPVGSHVVEVSSPTAPPPVPVQILRDAHRLPRQAPDVLVQAGWWLHDPVTRTGAILLSVALVAAGLLFLAPRTRPGRPAGAT